MGPKHFVIFSLIQVPFHSSHNFLPFVFFITSQPFLEQSRSFSFSCQVIGVSNVDPGHFP